MMISAASTLLHAGELYCAMKNTHVFSALDECLHFSFIADARLTLVIDIINVERLGLFFPLPSEWIEPLASQSKERGCVTM